MKLPTEQNNPQPDASRESSYGSHCKHHASIGYGSTGFSLPDCNGQTVSRDDFRGKKGLLVIFMCNHCPYVKHVAPELAKLGSEYMGKDVGVVGISSNDVDNYPDDSPEKMKEEAAAQGYEFPYLYDADQAAAQNYKAACTPDFYLFDADLKLVYRGQLDDSRPKEGSVPDGSDLRAALDALLSGAPIPDPQKPSIGCNIKWKAGAEPDYFNPAGTA